MLSVVGLPIVELARFGINQKLLRYLLYIV